MNEVTINTEQQLYVTKIERWHYTIGFDCLKSKLYRLEREYQLDISNYPLGSIEMYNRYYEVIDIVRDIYQKTGIRSTSELNKQLLPYLGKRVEVVYQDDTKDRFIVGKSSGWIPALIILKRKNSSSGGLVPYDTIFKSIKVIK